MNKCPICKSEETEAFNRNPYLHTEQIRCLKCKGYWLEDKHGYQTNIIEYSKIEEPKSRW